MTDRFNYSFRLLLLILMLVVGACTTTPLPGSGVPEIIRNVTPSIVSIANDSGAIGTGFVVDSSGLIATNKHIATKSNLFVIFPSGKRLNATLVATDKESDVAILAVKATNLLPLTLNKNEPVVGEPVVVIGNPFGLGITASSGIVSAVGRSIGKSRRLQTDAAINPGNSGGPMLDYNGGVIGIINSRITIGHGVGFAVPSSIISDLLENTVNSE